MPQACGALAGPSARIRSINLRDGAVQRAQEAVPCKVGVNVVSRDHASGVAVIFEGPLISTSARIRSINRRDGAVRHAQEAVPYRVAVNVDSLDHAS